MKSSGSCSNVRYYHTKDLKSDTYRLPEKYDIRLHKPFTPLTPRNLALLHTLLHPLRIILLSALHASLTGKAPMRLNDVRRRHSSQALESVNVLREALEEEALGVEKVHEGVCHGWAVLSRVEFTGEGVDCGELDGEGNQKAKKAYMEQGFS